MCVLIGQIQWGVRLAAGAVTASVLAAACASSNPSQTTRTAQAGGVLPAAESATDAAGSAQIDVTSTQLDGSPPLTVYLTYDFQHQMGEVSPIESDGTTNGGAILDGPAMYTAFPLTRLLASCRPCRPRPSGSKRQFS